MADPQHLAILQQGMKVWNQWRKDNPKIVPDLRRAILVNAEFRGINLSRTNLEKAVLRQATLSRANLTRANLRQADLRAASLRRAKLDYADLTGAILRHASLVETSVEQTTLTACEVYGISAWNLKGTPHEQSNLIIRSTFQETGITVDKLEIAQFIFLLLNNARIRDVIDTIGKKAVLILGRFTEKRKAVLELIREAVRKQGYLPILFDFEKPGSRDLTETVSTLAHLARFVIADVTAAKSIPQELSHIVPVLPSVPVAVILSSSQREYAMLEHFKRYPWVLPTVRYRNPHELSAILQEKVLDPAEQKAQEQTAA
jgi:hypothetical protein